MKGISQKAGNVPETALKHCDAVSAKLKSGELTEGLGIA